MNISEFSIQICSKSWITPRVLDRREEPVALLRKHLPEAPVHPGLGVQVHAALAVEDAVAEEIRDRGAFILANAMKANPKELSLERMCLGNNYLSEFGKAAIDEAASLVGEFNPKGGLDIPY